MLFFAGDAGHSIVQSGDRREVSSEARLEGRDSSRQDKRALERDMGRESEARYADVCFQVKDRRTLSNGGMRLVRSSKLLWVIVTRINHG